jgi:hypothetical protein
MAFFRESIYHSATNFAYCRTGTLWDGRYKAAIVDDERYVLTCMRYIELFPEAIENDDLRAIRDATQHAWALGNAAFREKITTLVRRGERSTGERLREAPPKT